MTVADTTTTETADPVAELERRFVEGEDVTPKQIEAAEREGSWARLKRQREEREAEKSAERARKDEVTALTKALVAELDAADQELPALYRQALAANAALVERALRRNDHVHDTLTRLSALGAEKHAGRKSVGEVAWRHDRDFSIGDRRWRLHAAGKHLAAAAHRAIDGLIAGKSVSRNHADIQGFADPLAKLAAYYGNTEDLGAAADE